MIIGLPIAFSMGLASLATVLAGNFKCIVIAQKMFTGMDSITMLAIPGFILAGEIMCQGGLAARLVNLCSTLIGHIRNGLSVVTIVVGMFFSAMNGSAPATTAAIGSLMVPEMAKEGYDKSYTAALAAIVGPLGPIIPPSIIMIVYSVGGEVSVGDLFLAGVVPGLLLGCALIVCSFWMTRHMNIRIRSRATSHQILHELKESIWALMTPVIILGGIYGGLFTPTEAAVVAVFYSIFVGTVIHKELSWKALKQCVLKSVETSAMVMFIVGAAMSFAWLVSITKTAMRITNGIASLTTSPIAIMIIINVVLVIVSCFMDPTAAVLIFQSVFLPLAKLAGINLLQFAAIFIVILAIGNATPPFGYSLFVACKIGDAPLDKISRQVIPMLASEVIILILINIFPVLTVGLPTLLG